MSTEVNHAERSHAKCSASGSERWINCPASVTLEENFPDETSDAAEEGTLAHEFAEIMLKVDLKLMPMTEYRKKVAELKKHRLYYNGMQDDVMEYVTFVKEEFAEAKRIDKKAILLIEQKFDLTRYVEGGFGTGDIGIIFTGNIKVIDFKFGKGKEVKAEHNPQFKYYGLGILESIGPKAKDIHTAELIAMQPRMNNVSRWKIPVKFLRIWGDDVLKPAAALAQSGEGEAKAGDWCQFCKARAKCRALYDLGMEIAHQDYEIKLDPRLLNDEELFQAYRKADFIKKWLEDVKATVLKEAIEGKKWPGHKLVAGKSSRVYTSESEVISVLEDNMYSKKEYLNVSVKGITELEKTLKKANFEKLLGHLLFKPPGAPTLVDEDDKREEYGVAQAKKDFADDYTDFEEIDDLFN